jgi:hypothetical protein
MNAQPLLWMGAAVALCATPPILAQAGGQPADGSSSSNAVATLTLRASSDLSVPASPAFAALGMSPSNIQRPGTVRELVAAVAQGFDSNGKPKNGVAIDLAPMPMFAPEKIVGGKGYADNYLTQALARTTVSLATAQSAGDATQVAWGVRVGIYDSGDPGLHWEAYTLCLRSANPVMQPGMSVDALPAQEQARLNAATQKCANETFASLWSKPALYVGYGQSSYSSSGRLRDLEGDTRSLWATWSAGMDVSEMKGMLHLHGERLQNDRFADEADDSVFRRQDKSSFGARLKLASAKWNAYMDVGRSRVKLDGQQNKNVRYWGLGAEFKIQDDVWLQVANVRESGLNDGEHQSKSLASLRFGSAPFLGLPGK